MEFVTRQRVVVSFLEVCLEDCMDPAWGTPPLWKPFLIRLRGTPEGLLGGEGEERAEGQQGFNEQRQERGGSWL